MLTKAEKESRVIELYEQDKTYREIAKEVHISLGDISSIIKRHTGDVNAEAGNIDQKQQEETIDQSGKTVEGGRFICIMRGLLSLLRYVVGNHPY